MKYNDPIILHENEVHQMLLHKIRRGSKVLEFGAAGGRMTELLAREYGCTVYIVEYEKEAFHLAMQYAADGMCSDIEAFQWKKWADGRFDHILFGDVLEHLRDPKKVLQETGDLLRDDGTVLLSIPNICHNDILVKLYDNRFEYTDVGLLDDTHIHFFSEHTLDSFVEGTGYVITAKQYKTFPTGSTEQYWKEPFHCKKRLFQLLQERENGEVYQFVLELKKEKMDSGVQKVYQKPFFMALHGLVYFDRGNGFSQDDVEVITGCRIQNDEYEFQGELSLDADIKRMRIDPVEGQACQLVDTACSLGTAYIPNKVLFEEKQLVLDVDPQIVWEVPKGSREVSYTIRIRLGIESLAKDIIRHDCFVSSQKAALEDAKACLEQKKTMLEHEKALLEHKNTSLENENMHFQNENAALENQKALLEQEKTVLEEENKCLESDKKVLEAKLSSAEQKGAAYENRLLLKEKELDEVYHSKSWRCTKFLRRINAWVSLTK